MVRRTFDQKTRLRTRAGAVTAEDFLLSHYRDKLPSANILHRCRTKSSDNSFKNHTTHGIEHNMSAHIHVNVAHILCLV